MRERVLLAIIFLVGQSACRGDGGVKGTPEAAPEVNEDVVKQSAVKEADACDAAALGLASAAALPVWTVPEGCTPGGKSGRTIARTEAELAGVIECAAGKSAGFDFSKGAILAVGYTMSPASIGVGAFDDGKVITVVSRFRSPCPKDPMPRPIDTVAWFEVPDGGERTFAEKSCTVQPRCD